MPIVRAQDPKASDKSHQIKLILGKMCDMEISAKTRQDCVEHLTALMQGLPVTPATFSKFGIESKLTDDEKTKQKILLVHVPKDYVSSGIAENRDQQWISFGITKVLDTEDLGKNDSVVIEDLKK